MSTDPLFMKIGSEYYYYHNDHLGTPQKMASVSGAVVWSAKYSSFGEASVEVESVENNLRFPGQYYDQDNSLHYNYHRYYSSDIGRYLKKDPIGFAGGDFNVFNYTGGNPIIYIDPKGMSFGQGFDFTWFLDQLAETLIGGKPIITTIVNVRWGKDCCCKGSLYRQKVKTVGLRIKIGTLTNVDGSGKAISCGPCKTDTCFTLSGGFNISQFMISRIPVFGGKAGVFINKFGTIRGNVGGKYCIESGDIDLKLGMTLRVAYIGSFSTSMDIF